MWFQKKQNNSELPDLPELPEISELPKVNKPNIKEELPALPSFPSSEISSKLSQQAIRAEISKSDDANDDQKSEIKHISEKQKIIKPYTQEISPEQEEVPEFKFKEESRSFEISPVSAKEKNPVFVRIDRFQNALKNLSEIKKNLQDIEAYLAEVKETRVKEDQELAEWERQIQNIKSKLELVDRTIFSKLE